MQTVLTIAGFDPSSGAGITADLKTFAAHGLFGTACITALTVQSTLGVRGVYPVDPAVIGQTLHCLDEDIRPAGVKIGMVSNVANTLSVSRYLRILNVSHSCSGDVPVVLDPVIESSTGRELIDADGLVALREELMPTVSWITPNVDELAVLSGRNALHRDDIPAASRTLQHAIAKRGVSRRLGIVVTGGHLDPPDDYMLMPEGDEFWFPGSRIETTSTHGTGCAFSSAFLCRLVLGDTPYAACLAAKMYIRGALKNDCNPGSGNNSINHLWSIMKATD